MRENKKNMKHGEFFSNLQYFCQMIFGNCSLKKNIQFVLITQENYVLGTFFYIFVFDLLKKSILQLAVTIYMEFGMTLSCQFEIIITFE